MSLPKKVSVSSLPYAAPKPKVVAQAKRAIDKTIQKASPPRTSTGKKWAPGYSHGGHVKGKSK